MFNAGELGYEMVIQQKSKNEARKIIIPMQCLLLCVGIADRNYQSAPSTWADRRTSRWIAKVLPSFWLCLR
jgi:hypothetical protein